MILNTLSLSLSIYIYIYIYIYISLSLSRAHTHTHTHTQERPCLHLVPCIEKLAFLTEFRLWYNDIKVSLSLSLSLSLCICRTSHRLDECGTRLILCGSGAWPSLRYAQWLQKCLCPLFAHPYNIYATLMTHLFGDYIDFRNGEEFLFQTTTGTTFLHLRGSLNKFTDFFRMGTFIDSTHMKL